MTTPIDEEITELKKQLTDLQNRGITVNVAGGQGEGKSSCTVKKTAKGDLTYELKVYSNDLAGAKLTVNTAMAQIKELEKTTNGKDDKHDEKTE